MTDKPGIPRVEHVGPHVCDLCGKPLSDESWYSIDQAETTLQGADSGQVQTAGAVELGRFCNAECADTYVPEFMAANGLQVQADPGQAEAAPCCGCGRLFNRLKPHGELVTLRITPLAPGTCSVGNIETVALLCPDCWFVTDDDPDDDPDDGLPMPVLLAA